MADQHHGRAGLTVEALDLAEDHLAALGSRPGGRSSAPAPPVHGEGDGDGARRSARPTAKRERSIRRRQDEKFADSRRPRRFTLSGRPIARAEAESCARLSNTGIPAYEHMPNLSGTGDFLGSPRFGAVDEALPTWAG